MKKGYRDFIVLCIHIVSVALAYYLSFLLRFDFSIGGYSSTILRTIVPLIVIKTLVFWYFAIFNLSLRYASIFDIWQICKATTISTLIFVLYIIFVGEHVGYPRSIFILDWGIFLGLTLAVRLIPRLIKEKMNFSIQKPEKRTLIVGAGDAGILVLKETRSNPNMNLKVIGFIDDDPAKRNLKIHGIKVLGTREKIPTIVNKYQIEQIIIAIPSATGQTIRNIISYCQIPQITLKIVPGLHKIINGELEIKLREVKPEDLLGRETVKVDEKKITTYLNGKRFLITGAAGSIGSELAKQIAAACPSLLILLDYNENDLYFLTVELKTKFPQISFEEVVGDVKDVSLLNYIFSKFKPQIVFHSAAFKNVPLLEFNPCSAVKNNIIATWNLINICDEFGIESCVFISTDKAVNPTSVMGATKRIAEICLQLKAQESKTKFIAVRFGNVLGSKGSVVPLFKKQIEEGGPVTVSHPQAERYFMSVEEAVQLVLQASTMGKGGEIFLLEMGEQIKILDLAQNLITLSGLRPYTDIPIEFIGLRAGEKISEQLLFDSEKIITTMHDKIYIVQPDNFDSSVLPKQIKELERLSNLMEQEKVIKKLQEILPEYKYYSEQVNT